LEFCPTCNCILLMDHKKKVLSCRKCGYKKAAGKSEDQKVTVSLDRKETVIVKDDHRGDETLPTTKTECASCGNTQAFYWMMQTRGADEPSTRFYRCTKCGKTWREYE